MTPRPRARAARRCSAPSTCTRRASRAGDSHQASGISSTAIPRLAKCRSSSCSRARGDSSGKHNSRLRRAVLTKPIGSRRSTAPSAVPTATITRNGSNAMTRNNPRPAQVSQYRGASNRSRIGTGTKNNPFAARGCDPMRPMSSAGTRYLEVRLAHLSLHRGGRNVLKAISWTIRPGERWGLAGANGAGKTQLLKLVAGVVGPKAAARPVLQYRLGRQAGTTPFGFKDVIAYLGAERQDKYQRYGWDVSAARIVGTGL